MQRIESSEIYATVHCEIFVGDDLAMTIDMPPDKLEAVIDVPVVAEKRIRIVTKVDSPLMLGSAVKMLQPRFSR